MTRVVPEAWQRLFNFCNQEEKTRRVFVRKKFILLLASAILALNITSCRIQENSRIMGQAENQYTKKNTDDVMDRGPVRGGTLKLFSTRPDTLNPILTNNLYVQKFSRLIFEGMVALDKKQKPVPVLVNHWDISNDGLTWTFHVRDNVMWHDNMALSAEDMEFTIETIMNGNLNSPYKKNVQNIAAFAAVNKNTLRLVLKKPNSFTAELMTFPILPKHYFVGEDMARTQRNMNPVGTGPYKFQSYSDESEIRLGTNENWWNSRNPVKNAPMLPYIAEISIRIYNTRSDSVAAFQAKDIDAAMIDLNDFVKFSGRSDLTMRRYPGKNFDFVAFDLTKPALWEKGVRQAISYAVDKVRLVNDVVPGEAVAADLPVLPDSWLNDGSRIYYGYDLNKAKELLAQNGWKKEGDVLYKFINGNITYLNFDMLVNEDNDIRYRFATRIAEQLKEIGIRVQVKKLQWDEELRQISSKRYDMALLGCSVSSIPDISFAYSTSEIYSGRNTAGYSNPAVDSYLEQILAENDSSKKKALFLNMKDIVNDEAPYIGLCFYNVGMVYNKRIRGSMNPHIWDEINDLPAWYIPVR